MSIYLEQLIQWNMQWFGWLSHQVSGGLAYMRQFHMESAIFRMALALFCGGIIGVERGRKNRAAGFRTHMLVCLGASITILLGQYEYTLLSSNPLATVAKTDVTRYGAQVISGVGFLGAGTILLTDIQEVKGLTTAAGLWASACMGLAIGAGFYECVLVVFFLILLAMRALPLLEMRLLERARNINLYLEFTTLDKFGDSLALLKELNVTVYDIDISHQKKHNSLGPNATLSLKLPKGLRREWLLAQLSSLENLIAIKEI